MFSPATVLKPYEPSDGSGATIAGVQVRNVLIVSSGVDQPGVVSLVLVNGTGTDQAVAVSADVDAGSAPSQSYFVPAGSSVHVGDAAAVAEDTSDSADDSGTQSLVGWFQIPQVPAMPGETVPMTFRVSGESVEVAAPIVLPCYEYSTITPTASTDEGATTAETPDVTCEPEVGEESESEH